MVTKNSSLLFALAILALAGLSIINCRRIVQGISNARQHLTMDNVVLPLKSFELINSALSEKKQQAPFIFPGLPVSPFRMAGSVMSEKRGVSVASAPLLQLRLQGTLNKENGLAILVDEQNKTYICKKGDTILTWIIKDIMEDKVTVQVGHTVKILSVVDSVKVRK
jgi:hypothetical protein